MSDINAADVYQRIRILEGQVAFLARAVNVNLPDEAAMATSSVPPDVIELARGGNAIEAIKRYRELTGCDLHEAKQVVDSLMT